MSRGGLGTNCIICKREVHDSFVCGRCVLEIGMILGLVFFLVVAVRDASACTILDSSLIANSTMSLNFSQCYTITFLVNNSGNLSVANATLQAPAYPYLNQSIQFSWASWGSAGLLNYSNAALGLNVSNAPPLNINISLAPGGYNTTFAGNGTDNVSAYCSACSSCATPTPTSCPSLVWVEYQGLLSPSSSFYRTGTCFSTLNLSVSACDGCPTPMPANATNASCPAQNASPASPAVNFSQCPICQSFFPTVIPSADCSVDPAYFSGCSLSTSGFMSAVCVDKSSGEAKCPLGYKPANGVCVLNCPAGSSPAGQVCKTPAGLEMCPKELVLNGGACGASTFNVNPEDALLVVVGLAILGYAVLKQRGVL